MYNPKELEEEVDHSFFDSDCDVSGANPGKPIHQEKEDRDGFNENFSKQAEKSRIDRKVEECESTKMGNKETEKEPRGVETLEKEMSRLEVQSGLMVKHGSESKEDIRIRKEASSLKRREDSPDQKINFKKEDSLCGQEDSDGSSRKSSPLPCSDLSESSHGNQSDESSSICSSSVAEENNAVFKNKDDCFRRGQADKKSTGKFRNQSHSHSLSSSRGERSPTPFAKPSIIQSNSPPRLASANRKQRANASETANSDDTVTDVTPLTSPDASPLQSFDLAPPTSTESTLPDTLETVDGQQLDANTDGEERSGRRMDRVQLVSSLGSASVSSRSSAGRRRKNFSFTTDEVHCIERENQRLLRELSHSSTRSSSRATHRYSAPPFRLYHSALNRQREQQRIQQENLAFLKRLESVKATRGMTRIEQLADYQRQAQYLGIPTPLIRPASGRSTRTCGSTSPHSTRPESSKPPRTMAPRPDWSI